MKTIYLLIKGKVQGVFYRATAKDVAVQTGLTGWVKNTEDGHVEVLATGTDEQLISFIQWCHKGSARAEVTEVLTEERPLQLFEKFSVIR